MPTLHEVLGARPLDNQTWQFHIPRELHGAFGGAFGGIVAACTLAAARSEAERRAPNALDCRFVRGLPAGDAFARTTVIHAGRTLTNVAVDLTDEAGRLCCRATISLVDPSVLEAFSTGGPPPGDWTAHEDAAPWPPVAPIVSAIDSRIVGDDHRGIATAVRIPWDDDGHSAEAACIAADMSVGPPLGAGVPRGIGTPNPDISLRFCGEVSTPILVGLGRLERASGGVAAVSIDVYSGRTLVAIGVSTALLLTAR